ncbi:MAG: RNA polymerase sigma factor [Anaerolineales bacterium]
MTFNASTMWGRAQTFSPRPKSTRPQRSDYDGDEVLVQACLNGDESAWQKLVERYDTLVFSIVRRMGIASPDAEDVCQNVFLTVYRRLATLRNRTALCAWLIKITQHEALRMYQRQVSHLELIEELAPMSDLISDHTETWEQRRAVQQALTQLDPKSRELLTALFFELGAPSYDEIARRFSIALGAIGPTRARSLKKLETILAAMDMDFSV